VRAAGPLGQFLRRLSSLLHTEAVGDAWACAQASGPAARVACRAADQARGRGESAEGAQLPSLNVFVKRGAGWRPKLEYAA
jgi:hypothetical protein